MCCVTLLFYSSLGVRDIFLWCKEDMEREMEGLSLPEEGDDLTLNMEGNQTVHPETQWFLVGRFLTNKPVRTHIMKDRMSTIWTPGRGVTIKQLEQGRFLFQFYHKLDMERTLKGGPWLFDNYMLTLAKVQPGDATLDIPLDHVDMWIQIFNLPFGFIIELVGKSMGNYIGEFTEYDGKNNSGP